MAGVNACPAHHFRTGEDARAYTVLKTPRINTDFLDRSRERFFFAGVVLLDELAGRPRFFVGLTPSSE